MENCLVIENYKHVTKLSRERCDWSAIFIVIVMRPCDVMQRIRYYSSIFRDIFYSISKRCK